MEKDPKYGIDAPLDTFLNIDAVVMTVLLLSSSKL